MTITKPGFYYGMSAEEYHGDPCPAPSFSQSLGKTLLAYSPAHARLEHPKLSPVAADDEPPEKYTKAKVIGAAAHTLMLGRGHEIREANFDNWMTKAAKEWRAENEQPGHVIILSKHLATATEMVNVARAQLDVMGWSEAFGENAIDGHAEVVMAWKEGDNWMRTMVDWMHSPTVIYDYKSSELSLAPHSLGMVMETAGWHVQASMHERGLDILDPTNAGRRKHRFVGQEQYPPYALVGVELDEHWMTMGRKKLQFAIDVWTRCMAADFWPAYAQYPICPAYPGFREAQWLERELSTEAGRTRKSEPILKSLMGG